MSLHQLPPEMIRNHLLPYLGNNDLLRLRQATLRDVQDPVPRFLQDKVQDYLQNKAISKKTFYIGHHNNLVELEREEGSWNHIRYMDMSKFLDLELPIKPRRFQFNFAEEEDQMNGPHWRIGRFIEAYGNHLTHLTLSDLTLPLEGPSDNVFFTGVAQSIQYLSIDSLYFNEEREDKVRGIPQFENLKTLKIGRLELHAEHVRSDLEYFWRVIRNCPNLEALAFMNNAPHNAVDLEPDFLDLGFQHVAVLLDDGFLPNLKSYNINNQQWINPEQFGNLIFPQFCDCMLRHKIKLENVHCSFFDQVTNPRDLLTIASVLYSMHDYSLMLGTMPFPHLEKIYIETASSKAGNEDPEAEFHVPEWPTLNHLQLTMNSIDLEDGVTTFRLFEVLFGRAIRPTVETLRLYGKEFNSIVVPLPDLVDIGRCFPNLTSITIENWTAREEEYAALWGRLRNLQSITLRDCRDIGLGAFTGDNEQEPVFLQLKNLKKLRLIRVQRMINITDDVFRKIFRHLPLKEFVLDSYAGDVVNNLHEVTSFTWRGIISLTTSAFANSIESFPYKCFRLQGMNRVAMKGMAMIFRSYRMK